jgi:hypothetical protein
MIYALKDALLRSLKPTLRVSLLMLKVFIPLRVNRWYIIIHG